MRAEQVVQERNRRFNKEQRGQTLASRRARERPPSQSSDSLPTMAGPETQSDPTRRSEPKDNPRYKITQTHGYKITQTHGAEITPHVPGEEGKTVTTDSPVEASSIDAPPRDAEAQPKFAQKPGEDHQISLSKNLRLGPCQTKIAKVHVVDGLSQVFHIGRVCPSKELEGQQCDLTEGLWEGAQEFEVPVINWGSKPIMFTKDTVVGRVEAVELVSTDDAVWKEQLSLMVATISGKDVSHQRKKQLAEQLSMGEHNTRGYSSVARSSPVTS